MTKTYAGRIAEWVLFLCMVMNIIEILVTLPSALSNIVLGTQVVMLDVGGFSLASMGDHAREQGDARAARRASMKGYFLIGVTIATLLLVTVGLLWSPAKPYTDMAEKGLILVRVVMTVFYAHVIHSLRRAAKAPPALVPSADVYARLDAYSEHLKLVQAEIQQHMREVQGSVSPLVQSVVQAQTHALMSDLQGVQSQFQEVYTLVQSLTRHIPEQGQKHKTASEQGPGEQVKRGTKHIVNPSITLFIPSPLNRPVNRGMDKRVNPLNSVSNGTFLNNVDRTVNHPWPRLWTGAPVQKGRPFAIVVNSMKALSLVKEKPSVSRETYRYRSLADEKECMSSSRTSKR